MSQSRPRKSRQPSKAAAYPFFFFALVTFLLDLPLVVPLFVLVLGFIVWKNQRDAIARAKLPPLPPAQPEALERHEDSDLSADQFGRTLEPLPYQTKSATPPAAPAPAREPVAPAPPPAWDSPPVLAKEETRILVPAPRPAPQPKPPAPRPAFSQPPARLLPNLGNAHALRQAIVTMTVIGPPRALDPFEPEPRRRARP